jgi:hypothetical protein
VLHILSTNPQDPRPASVAIGLEPREDPIVEGSPRHFAASADFICKPPVSVRL